MKKRLTAGIVLVALLAITALSGCKDEVIIGNFGEVGKSLYLYQDLAVQDVLTDEFDTAELDLQEYRGFLDAEIADYNKTADFVAPTGERGEKEPAFTEPVTVVKCDVASNQLNQQLIYAAAKDYNAYNEAYLKEIGGTGIKCGTLAEADEAILSTNFLDEKGELVDVQKWCRDSKAANYRYLIADFDCLMYGDGKVVAFARGMEYTKSKGCVATGSAKLSIVIFK